MSIDAIYPITRLTHKKKASKHFLWTQRNDKMRSDLKSIRKKIVLLFYSYVYILLLHLLLYYLTCLFHLSSSYFHFSIIHLHHHPREYQLNQKSFSNKKKRDKLFRLTSMICQKNMIIFSPLLIYTIYKCLRKKI